MTGSDQLDEDLLRHAANENSEVIDDENDEELLYADLYRKYFDDITPDTKRTRVKIFVYSGTLVACLSSILLGYDIGVMSGAILFVEDKEQLNLNILQKEVIISSLNLAALFGSLIAGSISDGFGRRKAIACASVLFIVGAISMAFSWSFSSLLIGRIVTGLGVGSGLLLAPLYAAELSPPLFRGLLVSFAEIFINVGILLGYIASFALSGLPNGVNWRWMLGLGALPAFVLLVGVFFISESPRWLHSKGKQYEAVVVLAKASTTREEVNQRLEEIKESLQLQSENQSILSAVRDSAAVRMMLVIGLGISFFQQATGIEAAVYYTPTTLKEAGFTSKTTLLGATVAVGFSKTLFTVGSSLYLDKFGRRPLLLASAGGMGFSLFFLGICFSVGSSPVFILVGCCLFVIFFGIGYGPVCWLIVSEIFPLKIRGRAMSLCTFTNRLVSGTTALIFLSLIELLTTAGTFYMYGIMALISLVFCYYLVPETKGKSLEQLSLHFHAKWDKPSTQTNKEIELHEQRSKQ